MKPTARALAVGVIAAALLGGVDGAWASPGAAQSARFSDPAGQRAEFRARTGAELLAQQRRVARASVIVNVDDKTCAGAVVESRSQVLTAAHCVPDETATLEVVAGRRRIAAVVALIDRTGDTALLALEDAIDVAPLELELELPAAGERVLFVGRPDRPKKAQLARVVRLGSCPSLPGVSDALFTSIQARPGDSGAPLVNNALRVVGIVHGGAACHIAAPTSALAKKLAEPDESEDGSQPSTDDDPSYRENPAGDEGQSFENSPTRRAPVARYELGPFLFEKVHGSNGVRFRFRFQLGNRP